MPPEVRLYIPPKSEEEFKSVVSKFSGVRIVSQQNVREDLSSDLNPELALNTLIDKTRETLSKLPKGTRIGNLAGAFLPESNLNNLRYYPILREWSDFKQPLIRWEKSRITRALRVLLILGKKDSTLEEVSGLDWDEIERTRLPNIGRVQMTTARKIFDSVSLPTNQTTLPGFNN